MPAQQIPHFQGKDVIGDKKILIDSYPGHTIRDPNFLGEAPYKVKDLPDIGDVHLDVGSVINVTSIRIKIDYRALAGNFDPPHAATTFVFDKTWERDDFTAVLLNGIYRVSTGLVDTHSDPTEGAGIRTVGTDEERNALFPAFVDEVISQNGTYYSAIKLAVGAWRKTRHPIQVSAKTKAHALNGFGNQWRQPALITTPTPPPRPPTHGTVPEKCPLIFFGDDGYFRDTYLRIGVFGPPDTSLFSQSHPGDNLGGGNPRTLTRFQDLLTTRVWLYDPIANIANTQAEARVLFDLAITELLFTRIEGDGSVFEVTHRNEVVDFIWSGPGAPESGAFISWIIEITRIPEIPPP